MAGHLFITRGDLRILSCDAVLVPSGISRGRYGHLVAPWTEMGLANGSFLAEPPSDVNRTVRVRPATDVDPAVWAGHTGDDFTDAEWYVEAALQFIRSAAKDPVRAARPLGDDRPLLGLPLVGARSGGAAHEKGEIVKHLVKGVLRLLRDRSIDADVVLVLSNDAAYAAAQASRSRYLREWRSLSEHQIQAARDLADRARRGDLVLFLGAGVSMGAGLPSWKVLLERLADQAEISQADRKELSQLDPRDAAAVIEGRLRDTGGLTDAIKAETHSSRGSLMHQLLASLPVREALTTNYDTLFEDAWRAAGRNPSVLPQRSRVTSAEWLVKLHGSVDSKSPLVLSRDDYMRFEGSSSALAGIVQAVLLTRHILFVGYSLSDENFHRIVHQVQQSTTTADLPGESTFGTVLTPERTKLVHEVWEDRVTFLTLATGRGRGEPIRRLAIFLDLLASEAASGADHLLNHTFDSVFNDEERALRGALERVRLAAAEPKVRDALRRAVADALRPFGDS